VACAVGAGTNGLISGFQNQARGEAFDGRTAEYWQVYNQATMGLEPDGVNYYLHCAAPNLDQSCGVPLTASCYDASQYSGVELKIRFAGLPASPKKARLALRTLATVPRAEGGHCDLGVYCNDSYRYDFDVDSTWQSVMIPWGLFAQAGFGRAPAGYVPEAEIMSILIAPQNGYALDVDIDDLALY
jgi:hypothetical protein